MRRRACSQTTPTSAFRWTSTATGNLTTVTCFPNSPPGTTGSFAIPCGYPFSIFSDDAFTSYPMGIAISPDAKTAYVVLDNNDTLTKIDLTAATPVEGAEIRVGNVPHSVVISPDGKTAYVSNEAGRIATEKDFQEYSNGTPVVAAYPTGSTATGTVSVVDLASFTVTGSIKTGLHPTGMAFWGNNLLVANAYSDSISVIDTATNKVVRTINLGLPIGVPGERQAGLRRRAELDRRRCQEQHRLRRALQRQRDRGGRPQSAARANPVMGMIPVGYAPSSVVLDTADNALLVANDKGWGTTGNPNPFAGTVSGAPLTANSVQPNSTTSPAVTSPTASTPTRTLAPSASFPCRTSRALWAMTRQVFQNNHWDLAENIFSAAGGNPHAKPLAIPNRIGDPSKIKHVFLIIRENRTYDQILGDVAAGNGDASLAVFGDNATYGPVTPNAHALVQRFPLFDNYYDPSRQSADGHNWIVQAMAPYSDDIQSPDWLRDYPSNGGDAIAYQKKGHLWDEAAKAGVRSRTTASTSSTTPSTRRRVAHRLSTRDTGVPFHRTLPFIVSDSCEPLWIDFYNDTLAYESGAEKPALQLQHGRLALPAPEPDQQHGPELPAVRSGHPRPVPRRYLEAGLRQGRGGWYGAPVGDDVDQLRPHRRPADRAGHAGR